MPFPGSLPLERAIGAELPIEAIAIDLVRGRLRAHGEVAWRDQGQCGLRFETQVPVEDWVRMIGHSGQQRADEMMSLFTRLPCGDAAALAVDERDSLTAISGELSELCEQLAGLPDLVARQPGELLRLDAIARRLNLIAAGG